MNKFKGCLNYETYITLCGCVYIELYAYAYIYHRDISKVVDICVGECHGYFV